MFTLDRKAKKKTQILKQKIQKFPGKKLNESEEQRRFSTSPEMEGDVTDDDESEFAHRGSMTSSEVRETVEHFRAVLFNFRKTQVVAIPAFLFIQ